MTVYRVKKDRKDSKIKNRNLSGPNHFQGEGSWNPKSAPIYIYDGSNSLNPLPITSHDHDTMIRTTAMGGDHGGDEGDISPNVNAGGERSCLMSPPIIDDNYGGDEGDIRNFFPLAPLANKASSPILTTNLRPLKFHITLHAIASLSLWLITSRLSH